MLSILISCYNYNLVPLVEELHKQAIKSEVVFELLAYDDASNSDLNTINDTVNSLEFCTFTVLSKNLGRSKIRNKLAQDARYSHLLFLDVDTFPEHKYFIQKYIEQKDNDVVYGGVINQPKPPLKPLKLRWLYTKKRERNSLSSANFFIKKDLFVKHPFDAAITLYGYEDVVFFKTLKQQHIPIKMIKNPVIHNDLDSADAYLKKVQTGLKNLKNLIDKNKISKNDSRIYYYYRIIKKLKLVGLVHYVFNRSKSLLLKNFNSSYPSLLLFDFYRLGYFCTLKTTS